MLSKSPEYFKPDQESKYRSGYKFFPVNEYPLMRKENLVSAAIDEPQTLSTGTGFMIESAARIFGPRFDIDSWSRTMMRTQGDLQVDTPVSFNRSPFARGFMEQAKEAAQIHDRDGHDPINEYLAAQTYLFAMKNQLQQDADRKDSFGSRRIKLSLINLLTSTNIKATEKIDIDKKLRPLTGRTTAEERRIHAMEQKLAVFAHSQNLTQMAPILNDLARDIYDTVPIEERNAQSISTQFEQTGKAAKRKRHKANKQAKSKTLQAEQYAGLSEEHRARLERREKIRNRPAEIVGAYGQEWEHKSPAKIASNAAFISTEMGNAWMPFQSDRRLRLGYQTDEETKNMLRGIKEIYVVQHGVMRNAKDYHDYFIKNFNKAYDPETMLVIAPQFLAPIDSQKPDTWGYKIKAEDVLGYGYNGWRCAEPALNKDAPIDSFTAMDELIARIIQFTPNLETISFRGNSEGGQFLNRYLAFSKKLNQLETDENHPIKIRGILSNPGTVLHLIPTLPLFDKDNELVGWKEFAFDDPVNRWGLGLYDPSPYILESLNELPHGEPEDYPNEESFEDPLYYAIKNLLRRTTFAIGEDDDLPGGFHLPMGRGPGPKAQGPTRLKRMIGLFGALSGIVSKKPGYFPPLKMMILSNVEHDASDVFKLTEEFNIDLIINDNLGFKYD